ncbi:MAG: aspartate--tRNA(Asn) ligase [Candidatus Hydrothermarchaeota archaeon]|jgi:aspartyl-tRNA synthetase|nr:aspartate--tRNA(Asn) ligase [Candidatus Hydrothermarchaeota archaeon]
MKRKYSNEITPVDNGSAVAVAGWVHDVRDLGGLRFLLLRDKVGIIQVTLPKKYIHKEIFEASGKLVKESVISVEGEVKAEAKAPGGYEIIPSSISVLSTAAMPLPLDPTGKVFANIDTRLDNRVMDLRREEIRAIFRVRDAALEAGRQYLRTNDFIEIHTPRIISTTSEGGTELFPIAYFEKEAFLAQSPQLYKQMMMSTGMDRVYEIATYFRAEEHNTVWHLNEITAIDCEMAFIKDEQDVLRVIENLIAAMIKGAMSSAGGELKKLNKKLLVPKLPLLRLTYAEALQILEEHGMHVPWGEDLTTEAEKKLGKALKERGHELYFVTKYPLKIKPFYTMPSDDQKYSNSFDLEFKGREIISGSQRIHDYDMLVKRIKAKKLNPSNFSYYLDAFKYGMPSHGGFGLGIERFVTLLLDLPNVRESVLFPRDRKRLEP